MSGVAGSVLKALKPHVPLIKFRKGGRPLAGGVLSTPGMSAPVGSSPRGTGIEEDVMPKKYARLQINEHEAELIMSGGAY
ncbi:uncharacterized protein LOC111261613 [Varroa jacobsoni]|uniref:Mitochondrial ribosomal protein S36 n=1 Tax=Varroa destructor TaxID=109461 RepID=A0A7M7KJ28_VARDE|nr:uncharacterized protein LOC111251727 [Varroa destructor]XP_022690960.1 uncharacterized protein LOC111261613 [Varroa jacobsoni]